MKYTEGICGDGAAILCDGQPITISEILKNLNELEFLKTQKPVGWMSDNGLYHSKSAAETFCTKRDSVKPIFVLPASI